jgi:isopentenyl-diphosphate delta-isomerase
LKFLNMEDTTVILVDGKDVQLGVEDKRKAHSGSGLLHRAVSVLLFRSINNKVETLLQKRSGTKHLWPEFWSNAVCTHPRVGESYEEAGSRRLQEEMGIVIPHQDLSHGFQFVYQAHYTPELAEHECDTVLFSTRDGVVHPDPKEVVETRWIAWDLLKQEIETPQHTYTPWFCLIVKDTRTEDYIKTI